MTNSLAHRLGLFGLLALSCLPFLVFAHTNPIPSFYVEWVAGALGLITLLSLFAKPTVALEIPRIVWLPLGLSALALLQNALGLINYSSQAMLAVLYLIWAVALMLATRRLAQAWGTQRLTIWLAWAVLTGGLLGAFIAILQFAAIDTGLFFIVRPPRGVIYGNLTQVNHFADYQAVALASLLYLLAQGHLRLRFAAPFGLLLLTSLALSGSRSAWLYLLAFTASAFWFFRRHKIPEARLLLIAALTALPFFFGLQLGLDALGVLTATHRLTDLSGFSIRIALWQDAWSMFTEAPWLGVGYQQYAWQHFLHILDGSSPFASLPDYEGRYAEHAHNIALHLLAEFGAAALPLLAWAGYCFLIALRNIASPTQWWLVALLAVLGIHSLLEYPLWYAHFLGVAAVLLALADPKPYRLAIPPASQQRLSVLFMALGTLALAMLWFGYVAIEQMALAWRSERTPQTVSLIRHNLGAAQAATFLEPQLDAFLAGLPVEVKEQEALDQRVALSAKVMRQMTNATIVYRHAAWLWLAGQKAESLALLDQAARAYPASRAQNVAELRRMVTSYPELEPLLVAARSAKAATTAGPSSVTKP